MRPAVKRIGRGDYNGAIDAGRGVHRCSCRRAAGCVGPAIAVVIGMSAALPMRVFGIIICIGIEVCSANGIVQMNGVLSQSLETDQAKKQREYHRRDAHEG